MSFPPHNSRCQFLEKEFLAIYVAFFEFAHILCEASKLTSVLTDNKSITRIFETKAIPPSSWNACDYVLQFNFKIAHIAGSVNTVAKFLSRLELNVTEKIHLKIRKDVQITPIEVTTSSSDVGNEKKFFFRQADGQNETENRSYNEKSNHRKRQQKG